MTNSPMSNPIVGAENRFQVGAVEPKLAIGWGKSNCLQGLLVSVCEQSIFRAVGAGRHHILVLNFWESPSVLINFNFRRSSHPKFSASQSLSATSTRPLKTGHFNCVSSCCEFSIFILF
jgi:hypothetical protein